MPKRGKEVKGLSKKMCKKLKYQKEKEQKHGSKIWEAKKNEKTETTQKIGFKQKSQFEKKSNLCLTRRQKRV